MKIFMKQPVWIPALTTESEGSDLCYIKLYNGNNRLNFQILSEGD
jgi:hypothetical protein